MSLGGYRREDLLWALREAAHPGGFCPHALGTLDLLHALKRDGLLTESDSGIFWHTTKKGRDALEEADNAS